MDISEQKPAAYEICVEGTLDPCWPKWLSVAAINEVDRGEKGKLTILSGEIADQATLFGLLLALYDLRLPLVSVKRLDVI